VQDVQRTPFVNRLRVLLAAVLLLPAATMAQTRITLANGEWPPYLSEHLPGYGSLSRVVSEAFASQGIHVDYRFYPWRRAYVEANDGHVDGTLVWTRTPEREADFLLSDPVSNTEDVFFYNKKNPLQWQQLSDLGPVMLGGTIGYTYGDPFQDMESKGLLHVQRISDEQMNFSKLMLGHIYAFPMDREVGIYLLNHSPRELYKQIDYAPKVLFSAPLYVLIPKKNPNAAELVRRFNLGLAQLRKSGKVDQYIKEGRDAP
jgi:polar amino acid transport system substrate-binding protein